MFEMSAQLELEESIQLEGTSIFFYFGIKGSSGLVTLAFLPSVESFIFSNCSIWYVLKTWPDFSQGFKQSEILWLSLVSI